MQATQTNPTQSTVRVMIVEDQTAIRQLLAQFLAASPGFTVVAQASDAAEALRLAAEHQPQVVVLDWMLPNGSGLDFLRHGLGGQRPPRVLVFSASATDLAVRDALTHGAKGYLEKTADFSEFTDAMRAMADGKVYLSDTVARVVHRIACEARPTGTDTSLTEREIEVLACVAEGLSSKEIANRLDVSVRTVGNHRSRISAKTGLTSIAQLTLHAVRLGLVAEPATAG
jgi:DNA-binding NarL/FixJ family response regulator